MKLGLLLTALLSLCAHNVEYAEGRNFSYNFRVLEDLAYRDLKIAQQLTKLQRELSTKNDLNDYSETIRIIKEYMLDFDESSGKLVSDYSKKDAEKVAGNPSTVFRLLHRWVNLIESLIFDPDVVSRISNRLYGDGNWPSVDDLDGAAEGILRIQQIQDIDPKQVARGNITGQMVGGIFNSIHCFEMGRTALKVHYYALAVEWLELALQKSKEEKNYVQQIEKSLENAKNLHDQEFRKRNISNYYLFDQPIGLSKDKVCDQRTARRRTLVDQFRANQFEDKDYRLTYYTICRGQSLPTHRDDSKLFCWNEFDIHPKYRIGPIKMELLHRNPDILVIRKVVNDGLIKTIIKYGGKDLNLQDPAEDHSQYNKSSDYDTVWHSCYLRYEDRNQHFQKALPKTSKLSLSRLLEHATGFETHNMQSSEPLFYKTYTFTGWINFHHDAENQEPDPAGRIATTISYLNDVAQGGETVLLKYGVKMKPEKGSILIWFNKYSDGDRDWSMVHAVCPIVQGKKLIASKWVIYRAQFQKRKYWGCDLQPRKTFRIKTNGQ